MEVVRRLRETARQTLPEVDWGDADVVVGEFHDVVLARGRAVVKVARGRAVRHLTRRAALLAELDRLDLPFATPTPLSPVLLTDDRAALALSWVDGGPPPGPPEASVLSDLLAALSTVDVTALAHVLDVPHAYAGREAWEHLMRHEVPARVPPALRDEAVRRVERALSLPAAAPGLVHGDLAGSNLLWDRDGHLAGVLDWDLASAHDPAVDVGCLAWFGWDVVEAAADAPLVRRARVWADTFGLEQVAAALDNGEPEPVVQRVVDRVVVGLTASGRGRAPLRAAGPASSEGPELRGRL